jgi:hypothetical protein
MSGLSSLLAQQVNTVVCVGGGLPSLTGGGDIGAEINYAYTNLLPSTGGTIYVLPQTAGANGSQPYAWTTAIVFGTAGKYVALKGLAPANQSNLAGANLSQGGVTLNWTGTTGGTSYSVSGAGHGVAATVAGTGVAVYTAAAGTFPSGSALVGQTLQVTGFTNAVNNGFFVCTAQSTSALTLANGLAVSETGGSYKIQLPTTAMKWANDPGSAGDGFAVANTMEDLCLVNNAYNTGISLQNGGSGYCTIGLDFTGAGRLQTKNLRIAGFGVGKQAIHAIGWGAKDFNQTIAWCNVGFLAHNCMEDYGWFGGQLIVNGIGLQTSGTTVVQGDFHFYNVSIDSQTIFGILSFSGMSCDFGFYGCHFENLSQNNTHYIFTQANSALTSIGSTTVQILGGLMSDDANTGTTDYYVSSCNGYAPGVTQPLNLGFLTVSGLSLLSGGRAVTSAFLVGANGAYLQGNAVPPVAQPNIVGGSSASLVTNLFNVTNPFTFASGISVNGGVQTATGIYSGSSFILLSTTAQHLGVATNSSVFYLRDGTVGGTVMVTVDNVNTQVVLTGAAGASGGGVFVAGVPGAGQIGLSLTGGFLTAVAAAGSARIGDKIEYVQNRIE